MQPSPIFRNGQARLRLQVEVLLSAGFVDPLHQNRSFGQGSVYIALLRAEMFEDVVGTELDPATQAQLARRARLSARTIHAVEQGASVRLDTERKVLQALGLRFKDRAWVFPQA